MRIAKGHALVSRWSLVERAGGEGGFRRPGVSQISGSRALTGVSTIGSGVLLQRGSVPGWLSGAWGPERYAAQGGFNLGFD